jgi:hypothetical protein
MRSNTTQTQFGTPTKARDSVVSARKGRRCLEPGCPTLLSTYNPAETCWLHAPSPTRHPLARD